GGHHFDRLSRADSGPAVGLRASRRDAATAAHRPWAVHDRSGQAGRPRPRVQGDRRPRSAHRDRPAGWPQHRRHAGHAGPVPDPVQIGERARLGESDAPHRCCLAAILGRSVMDGRVEFKYLVSNDLIDVIRRDLQPYVVADVLGGKDHDGEYTVRSIYYDTPQLECYETKLDGLKVRNKFRIRGYD